ncbi:MAG: tRNA (guanosine(46)-N7)-methyltransferase TrmB, partial [Gammaproteobacteria bacterium]
MAEATDRTATAPPSPSAPPHRSIRSYVRREGRITEAQQQALATWSERFCIGPGAEPLDFNAIFGRDAERYLEVGCGAGEVLIALASEHPENDYLGVEVYRPGLGRLLRGLAERRLENVRILCGDAASLIEYQVSDQSLAGVYVFFPDPWPKKRHHKRRLMRPDFVAML